MTPTHSSGKKKTEAPISPCGTKASRAPGRAAAAAASASGVRTASSYEYEP